MSDDDEALKDLAVRLRQLEAHLLCSPEYLARAGRKVAWLAALLGVAVVLFLFEGIFCLRGTRPEPPVVLGSIDVTTCVVIASCVLIIRAKRCFRHLNETWLSSEAKKTLETLRREQAELKSRTSPPNEKR
jgi:hypothetical protein